MHRFYLPPEQCQGEALVLGGREAHHAWHVLRVQRGERVTVLDGAGQECLCEVQGRARDVVELVMIEKRFVPRLPYHITLLQALPKGKLIESIVQKATELGVARIVPLLSSRVVAHLDAKEAQSRVLKWQMVAVEAIKQSGSAWLPRVDPPVTPQEFLTQKETFELSLIGSLQTGSRHPRKYFSAFQREHNRPAASVCIWVGPEGDFTPEELVSIQSAGALPITLGRQVLRTETAAVYCLSIINYELQASCS
jgi:16S rRNA (uracil1498-N3)-methyltransferase